LVGPLGLAFGGLEGAANVKEALVIWLGIILLIGSMLFPPYGYTKVRVATVTKQSAEIVNVDTNVVPWTYVRHQFLLSEPNTTDPRLRKKAVSSEKFEDWNHVLDMRIAWHIAAIQAAIIILVTGGAVFTLRVRRNKG